MKAGVKTSRNYVRYSNGVRKHYRAILDENFYKLRVSHKWFEKASEAESYRAAVLARLERLRSAVQS
jgi:hypothetical protein